MMSEPSQFPIYDLLMPEHMKSRLVVGTLRLLGKLPLAWLHGLSKLLLIFVLLVPNQSRTQTRLNIQRCWPNLTHHQQIQLIRQSLQHTIYAAFEMGINWTQPNQRGLDSITTVTGLGCLQQAQATGGVVLLTPHLGNWELFANWAAQQVNLTALYKPAKLPGLAKLMHDARSAAGMKLAPATAKGVMQLKRSLLKGEVNLILPDQEPPPTAGIISPWFDQPAYTMTLASQLAHTKNTRVIMGFARRLDASQGFAIEIEDITDQCQHQLMEESVAAINQALETLIKRAPAQYQWEYRRFKHTLEQS
jgi:KDO2-lipid IV(A) lauroyltransferase